MCSKKHGKDRLANYHFGKLQARAVLRDVGRVLQCPMGKWTHLQNGAQ